MNLAKMYVEKIIWSNVTDINIYKRAKKEMIQSQFTFLLGAPEIISQDKKYALIIDINNCLPPDSMKNALCLEYSLIHFQCRNSIFFVYDAAITYTHLNDDNHLMVEINAVNVEIYKTKVV